MFVRPITVPFREAFDFAFGKVLVGSKMTSAEWDDVVVALRQRAFFSAQVESARFLQKAQDLISDFLSGAVETLPDGTTMLKVGSRAKFVDEMLPYMQEQGFDTSRMELIFNVQTQQADGYGYWRQGMQQDVLDEFPASRFIRVQEVKQERAAHVPFENQVYLKTDPIWSKQINKDFGVPWAPFGWGCGHDIEDVDRDATDALGLTKPGQEMQPQMKDFNENLRASTVGMEPDLIEKLKGDLGDQVEWDEQEQEVRWRKKPRTGGI